MVIESIQKQLRVGKFDDAELLNRNAIYFDFETGLDTAKDGR